MKKLEDAKKFVKENIHEIALIGISATMFAAGALMLCKSVVNDDVATAKGITTGVLAGADLVMRWAMEKVPDANLNDLWKADYSKALEAMNIPRP